jgi:hypothetical protein
MRHQQLTVEIIGATMRGVPRARLAESAERKGQVMKKHGIRLAAGAMVVAAVLAVGSGTAGAVNSGPPTTQVGVATATSAIGNPELAPGLGFAIGVLGEVPAVQVPPSPIEPGFGVLTQVTRG